MARLKRPCKLCEEYYSPIGRYEKYCPECRQKIKDEVLKRRILAYKPSKSKKNEK